MSQIQFYLKNLNEKSFIKLFEGNFKYINFKIFKVNIFYLSVTDFFELIEIKGGFLR